MVHCSSCGKENKDKAKFCIRCGNKIHAVKELYHKDHIKISGMAIASLIFIVLMGIGMLAYFGVLSPDKFLPKDSLEDQTQPIIQQSQSITQESQPIIQDTTTKMSISDKLDACTRSCAGDEYDIPAMRQYWYDDCYESYYYNGEEELDKQITDCR
jgi:hypothetical protein